MENTIMNIPDELDGAKVIQYTKNSTQNEFGVVNIISEDNEVIDVCPITALAICKYSDGNGYYLFSCDLNWEVVGDTFHYSLEEAIDFADVKETEWLFK
ncbi:hypothetical protein IM538_04040 [Cytobacillus suaedae]|nr:hypothetical protein IM538_04040 [Cytobacillus suaedae]